MSENQTPRERVARIIWDMDGWRADAFDHPPHSVEGHKSRSIEMADRILAALAEPSPALGEGGLLLCPFCGGGAISRTDDDLLTFIACQNGCVEGSWGDSPSEAAAWNTRVSPGTVWLPISSAPKDGRELWGCSKHQGAFVMQWAVDENRWKAMYGPWKYYEPTHFMHLPPAPEVSDG